MYSKKTSQKSQSMSSSGDFNEIGIATITAMRTFYNLRWDDLHGCSVDEAKSRVKKAIMESVKDGCRTCRIITGRGNHINAKGQRGVIFAACETWLESVELKPYIESYEKRDGHYVVKIKRLAKFNFLEKFNDQNIELFYKNNLCSIEKSADIGEAKAQFLLGCAYTFGVKMLSYNYKKAFELLSKSAAQEYGPAQEFLGMFYYVGEGIRQNDKKAMEWLEKAVNNGQGMAAYILSSAYFYGFGCEINTKLSAVWAMRGATLGDITSMRRVGNLYLHGYPEESIPKDINKAVHWYMKAAQQGDPYSQYQIGYFCQHGEVIPLNLEEAFKWYLLSAKGGDTDAMISVATCYLRGIGCDKNREEAKEWLEKADELGHPDAKLMLSAYHRAIGNIQRAFELRQASADSGSVRAQMQLFVNPTDGYSRQKSIFQLLEQPIHELSKHTPLYMQFMLGMLLLMKAESSEKTKKNNQRGILLLEELAEKGYTEAMLLLGWYFSQKNSNKAVEWWEKGSLLGNIDCMFLVGIFCLNREKIKDAEIKSKRYLDMAVQARHPAALLYSALKIIKPTPPENDEELEKALAQLLSAIEQAQKIDRTNYAELSLGVELVPAKALLALITILLWQPYRLDLNNSVVEASLAQLRQAAKENNRQIQYYLGIFLVLVASPLVHHREATDWIENLSKEDASIKRQPWLNAYLLFSKHCKPVFVEGLELLVKAADEGNSISKEIIATIFQNPFYTVENLCSISGFEFVGMDELNFGKISLYQLIKEKMEAYKLHLLKSWQEESKRECNVPCYPQSSERPADKVEGKSKMQSGTSDALVDASVTMAMIESLSQLFKLNSVASSADSMVEESQSQVENKQSIKPQSIPSLSN